MNRLSLLLLMLSTVAQAQAPNFTTVEVTETPTQWQLRDGQGVATGVLFPTRDGCIEAIKARATETATGWRCTNSAVFQVKSTCVAEPPPLPNDGTRTLWGEQDPLDDTKWHLFESGWISVPWPECWKLGPSAIHVPDTMIEWGEPYVPPLDPGALRP